MTRESLLSQLARTPNDPWDLVVIGGGAVGMGCALDAVTRGYSCVLLEQHDFCKGTSSRSTKIVHGGVRYLAQGNVSLVREALHERGLLLRNAKGLVKPLRFIIPCYSFWERWYYWSGLKCYDALAGRLGIEGSRQLSNAEFTRAVPGLREDDLRGGVAYFDAQFDDARMVIAIAQKVQELGGLPLNYVQVTDFIKEQDRLVGVRAMDVETNVTYEVHGKAIVNAAGVFSDNVRKLESPAAPKMIAPSQGIHLVVDQKFLGGEDAVMIPKTQDGRVLFAIPWLGRVILGTTDTPVAEAELEPKPLEQEVDYLIEHFQQYFDPAPGRDDVLSVYAGLRPLVKPQQEAGATSKISREHRIVRSAGGLLSILGGKWTTFRKMAEDVVDEVEQVTGLQHRASGTRDLVLTTTEGSKAETPDLAPSSADVLIAARDEFARNVEDVLARRFRCLLLDAKGSTEFAPDVARVLKDELGHSQQWADQQVREYERLAGQYCL